MPTNNISLGLSDAAKLAGTWYKSGLLTTPGWDTGYELENVDSNNIGIKGRTSSPAALTNGRGLKVLDENHVIGGANIENHNLTENAIAQMWWGKDVVRPSVKFTTLGDRAVGAATITSPESDYTWAARMKFIGQPGDDVTSAGPLCDFLSNGAAATDKLARLGRSIGSHATNFAFLTLYHFTGSDIFSVTKADLTTALGDWKLVLNRWTDWVVRYTDSTQLVELYVNGALVDTQTAANQLSLAAGLPETSCQALISSSTNRPNVTISVMELWGRAWSDAEVTGWKAEDRSGSETDLVYAYTFREGAGATVADDGPNASTLTLTGGTWASTVDDRRIAQDGYDGGEMQVWHDPPRRWAFEFTGSGSFKTPATVEIPRSFTMDLVFKADPLQELRSTTGFLLSIYKVAIGTDSACYMWLHNSVGLKNLWVSSFRGTAKNISQMTAAQLRNGADGRHIRAVVDGEDNELRTYVDGVSSGLISLDAYAINLSSAVIQVGGPTATKAGIDILHATVREGIHESAADLALGWKPRPHWTEGLIAQIEFTDGVPKDTGPNSYTLTPSGTLTYTQLDNPDPNASTLPRARYGYRDEAAPLAAYPRRFVVDGTNTTSNQFYFKVADPYNSDAYLQIGKIGYYELFTPTYGRTRANPASRSYPHGTVNRTAAGIVWSPRDNRPGVFSFVLDTLQGSEPEELLAGLVRYLSNTATPILVIDRSRPTQPLIDRVFWGPAIARNGLEDPGPEFERLEIEITNQEDYGNG